MPEPASDYNRDSVYGMISLSRIDRMDVRGIIRRGITLCKKDPRGFVFARLSISISLYIRNLIIVRGSCGSAAANHCHANWPL